MIESRNIARIGFKAFKYRLLNVISRCPDTKKASERLWRAAGGQGIEYNQTRKGQNSGFSVGDLLRVNFSLANLNECAKNADVT